MFQAYDTVAIYYDRGLGGKSAVVRSDNRLYAKPLSRMAEAPEKEGISNA